MKLYISAMRTTGISLHDSISELFVDGRYFQTSDSTISKRIDIIMYNQSYVVREGCLKIYVGSTDGHSDTLRSSRFIIDYTDGQLYCSKFMHETF